MSASGAKQTSRDIRDLRFWRSCGHQRSIARPPRLMWTRLNLRQLGLDLVRDVDRAPAADIVEMPVEEAPGGALAELAQCLEIFVVGLERAAGAERVADVLHHDAMKLEPPEFPLPRSPRQASFVDETVDEGDPAQLRQQRRVEVDLVDAAHDLARVGRHLAA